MICMSSKPASVDITWRACSTHLEIIFMPIASLVVVLNWMQRLLPARAVFSDWRRANRLVELKAFLMVLRPDSESSQILAAPARSRVKAYTKTTGHTIAGQDSDGTATGVDGLTASTGTGNKHTLSSGHGDEVALAVNNKCPSNTDGKGEETDDVLATGAKNALPIVVLVRKFGRGCGEAETNSPRGREAEPVSLNLSALASSLRSMLCSGTLGSLIPQRATLNRILNFAMLLLFILRPKREVS